MTNIFRTSLTCTVCKTSRTSAENMFFCHVSVSTNIQEGIQKLCASETLSGCNSVFCDSCGCNQPTLKSHSFEKIGKYLILHLSRFYNFGGKLLKDQSPVLCSSRITVACPEDNEVSFDRSFDLIAAINHSGTLDHGHYTSDIKDIISSTWYHCNDRAVIQSDGSIDSNLAYVLIYREL